MFRQDDLKLNMIKRFGCYFMSLGHIAEQVTGETLSYLGVISVMAECINRNYSDPDLYINKPDRIIEVFARELGYSVHAGYIGWWNLDKGAEMWSPAPKTHTILRFKWGAIFHFKMEDYDPHPGLKLGSLTGKRYFSVKG